MNEDRTCANTGTNLTQPRSVDVPWGFTYFIRRGDAIKIGHSAIPKQRICSLQVAFPDVLEELAIVPNTIVSEAGAHAKFAHLRMSGEWFRAEPELLEFIQEVKIKAGQMPKSEPVIRPLPKGDPLVSQLQALRAAHGAKSAIGYRCSNLAEMVPAYRMATDPEQKARLAAGIQRQMADMARLRAGLQ